MGLIYGNALKFVSSLSQYIALTTPSSATNNITIAFWLTVNTLPASLNELFSNGNLNSHNGYRIYLNSSGNIVFDMTFVANCNAGVAFTIGSKHHVIAVRDAGTTKFYIDGAASGTTTGATWNSIALGGDIMAINAGWRDDTGFVDIGDCTYDDFRYYERAVNSTEATNLYNFGNDPLNGDISSTNLKVWLKLENYDPSTGKLLDSSGNGNNFIPTNKPTFINPGMASIGRANKLLNKLRPAPFKPGVPRGRKVGGNFNPF